VDIAEIVVVLLLLALVGLLLLLAVDVFLLRCSAVIVTVIDFVSVVAVAVGTVKI
jgi:hypothetical protein